MDQLVASFDKLKGSRRAVEPEACLLAIGVFAEAAHDTVSAYRKHPVPWIGSGIKSYSCRVAANARYSRAVNDGLYVEDHGQFRHDWQSFIASLQDSKAQGDLAIDAAQVDRAIYTAVMAWAVATDIEKPSPGLVGTFYEMVLGPSIAILSDRDETGPVAIPLDDGTTETVTVDLTFHGKSQSLAVPTKWSTRERISQAYVHAAILEKAFPNRFKTVLCVGNETNYDHDKRAASRGLGSLRLKETLVPRTISLYQKYIGHLDGLYYLDPPERYRTGQLAGFPKCATVGQLLAEDLRGLLQP